MQCAQKGGTDAYAVHAISSWIDRISHNKLIVQTDSEDSVKALARKVKGKCSAGIVLRARISGKSASLGAGEQVQGMIAGCFRFLKSELEAELKHEIQIDSPLVAWMIRHWPWARTRFCTYSS